MIWIILLGITALCSIVHLARSKKPRTAKNIIGVVLIYLFALNYGLMGIMAFYQHAFNSAAVAAMIGWQPSPFQFEMAMTNLAIGVLGLLCIFIHGDFWLATAVNIFVIYLGCAYGHWVEMTFKHNLAPYNAGLGIWLMDVIMPMILLALVLIERRLKE